MAQQQQQQQQQQQEEQQQVQTQSSDDDDDDDNDNDEPAFQSEVVTSSSMSQVQPQHQQMASSVSSMVASQQQRSNLSQAGSNLKAENNTSTFVSTAPLKDFETAVRLCAALNMEITKARVERHLASAKEFAEAMAELDKKVPFKGFAAPPPVTSRKRQRLGQGYELLERIGCGRCGADTDKKLLDESNPEAPTPKICEPCRIIMEDEQLQQAAQAAMRKKIKKSVYKPTKKEIQMLRDSVNPW
eukprot:TRINITY_DN2691_c0_g2_i1.p1 TRINITY_DN2691_c0_g2~~TRINITY_DN2691_c0_g2_i1.p1  ORF type:complete len:244 (-),score=89.79 TRINITY_DN2691_c0_g2_i1:136-867(-)